MADWQVYFLAQAWAARVLTGLVFVGVSINLEKILSQPDFGLPGRAAEALILLPGSRRPVYCSGQGRARRWLGWGY